MQIGLKQSNLRDQALEILKYRLVSGDLAPGEVYSAAALANELGVSNSPVREAMLTLVNQGLMETVRNRGFRVVPLTGKELHNLYDVRVMLEVPAMEKLTSDFGHVLKARAAEFSQIAGEIVTFAENGDIVNYLDADRRFHLGLIDILENEQLSSIVGNLRDQSRQYGLKALYDAGKLTQSADEHQPILDAMVSGDVAQTRGLMQRHLRHLVGDWAG